MTDAIPGQASVQRNISRAYGAVLGRVQTLSSRGSFRFTLYDLVYNKAVSCYLEEDQQDMMRDAWDHVALVRGLVKRDPVSGRPISVRQVRGIELRNEGVRGAWREAAGVLVGAHGGEPAEAIIRRLRDAELLAYWEQTS